MKAFAAALDSLEKPRFSVGQIAPTARLVNQYFNASTGEGDRGEIDARGPWNEGKDWELVESAIINGHGDGSGTGPDMQTESFRSRRSKHRARALDRSSPRSFARREANRESTSQNGQGCQIGAARHVVQPASPRN